MSSRTNTMLVVAVIAVSVVACARLENVVAQTKTATPKPQDNLALGETEVKKLLLLMETDKNGKVSKQTFMEFMENEFERLDKNKTGELDAKELTQSSLRGKHVGK
jgi:Ca2+-binding EF-hand superfamily protein